jgi:pilus assembly protein CpaC
MERFYSIIKRSLCIVLAGALILNAPYALAAEKSQGSAYEEIQILKGDMQTVIARNIKRVSITDPLIADINDATANAVEILGVEPGQTILFVWDDSGKRTVVVRVVSEDPKLVKKRLEALLASAGIEGVVLVENTNEGKVVLSGNVSEDEAVAFKGIIDPFAANVMDLTQKIKVEDLVQVDIQVTELSTTLDKQLGVNWGTSGTDGALGNTLTYTENTDGNTGIGNIPRQSGSFQDLFKVGDFSRTPALVAQINMMIAEGKGKVLSKPRLVVVSGKEATLQVGGEVPIQTTTTASSTSTTTSSSTFKPYGVSMSITPTIENGKINSTLSVEISDIDRTNKADNGDVAFTTRSAQTQLVLEDRQTIVLAGMIKRSDSKTTRRVPILGAIPFFGALFRSTITSTPETEVVISITATILHSGDKNKLPTAEVKPVAAEIKPAVVEAKPVVAAVKAPVAEIRPVVTEVKPAIVETKAMVAEVKPVVAAQVVPVKMKDKEPKAPLDLPATTMAALKAPASFEAYAIGVQRKVASAIAYPYEAQEKGWQGTVDLGLTIKKDGTLKDVIVKNSSGYPVFDQDAVNTAQILAPYAAFPSGAATEEITLIIPIVYSLDAFLKNVGEQK